MARKWYPISPLLTPEGTFAALSHLPNGKDYKPTPEDVVDPDRRFLFQEIGDKSDDLTTLASLGIVGLVSASASVRSRAIVRDVLVGHIATQPVGAPGPVRGTLWGAGFRLTITLTDIAAEFKVDTRWAAAVTSLGLASSSYEMRAFGINQPSLIKPFPATGRLDQAAVDQIFSAQQAVLKYIEDNRESLVAVPVAVELDEPPGVAPLLESRAVFFAVQRIYRRDSLKEASARAATRNLHVSTVIQTYRSFAPGLGDDEPPPEETARKAKRWIQQTEARG